MIKELTRREREILLLKANGNINAQIAHWLGIRQDSVSATLTRAYRKLGTPGRGIQAAAVALALGELGIHEIHIPDEQKEAIHDIR